MNIYLREIRMSRVYELLLDRLRDFSSMEILANIRVLHIDHTYYLRIRELKRYYTTALIHKLMKPGNC